MTKLRRSTSFSFAWQEQRSKESGRMKAVLPIRNLVRYTNFKPLGFQETVTARMVCPSPSFSQPLLACIAALNLPRRQQPDSSTMTTFLQGRSRPIRQLRCLEQHPVVPEDGGCGIPNRFRGGVLTTTFDTPREEFRFSLKPRSRADRIGFKVCARPACTPADAHKCNGSSDRDGQQEAAFLE